MKLFNTIIILLLCVLSSCTDNNKQYVGTWVDSYDLGILGTQSTDLTLYEDYSCNLKLFGTEMSGTWEVDGDMLILKLKAKTAPESDSYSVSKFNIVRINDTELFLKKCGTHDVTEYHKK